MNGSQGTARAISSLFSGTVVAQTVSLLGSFLLARFYTPGDFGILAGFIGIVSIVSILITGRFE